MDRRVKVILSLLCSVILTLLSYIVLHEGGHCIVAFLCGAKITRFSVLGAYMSYDGGVFNTVTYSLLHAAGMLFPVLISFVFMLFYREYSQSIFYRIFSAIFSLLPFFSTVAWVFVPILYIFGEAPSNDDVTKFINASELSPWVVCGAAILLFTAGFLLAWKKKVIQNYLNTCRGKTDSIQSLH